MRRKVTFAMAILSLIASTAFVVGCNNSASASCEHSGGKATCIQRAVCEKCGEEYGELAAHSYGEWQHDGEKHWKECVTEGCSAKTESGNHDGGTATCKNKAVCSVCGNEYGELNAENHASEEYSYVSNSDGTHKKTRKCCGATVAESEACSGGAATCVEKATCEYCNAKYGELSSEHTWSTEWSGDETKHWHACSAEGCVAKKDEGNHEGGSATHTEKAVCDVCGREYGDFSGHVYGEWKHDEEKHWKECTIDGCSARSEEGNHEGGTATHTEKAVCEICGEEYGETVPHTYGEWKHDATGHWKECACGAISDKEPHSFVWDKADSSYDYKVCDCGERDDSATFNKTVSLKNQEIVLSGTEFSLKLDGISAYESVVSITYGDYKLGNNPDSLYIGEGFKEDTQKHGEQTLTVTVKGSDEEEHEVAVSVLFITKEIKTMAELQNAVKVVNDKESKYGYYILGNDVAYTEADFTPVAAKGNEMGGSAFRGVLDGRTHTITVNSSKAAYGLFGTLNGATIKNVTIKDAWNNNSYCPMLARNAYNTAFENVTINIVGGKKVEGAKDSTPFVGNTMQNCVWKDVNIISSVEIVNVFAIQSDNTFERVTIKANVTGGFSIDSKDFPSGITAENQ